MANILLKEYNGKLYKGKSIRSIIGKNNIGYSLYYSGEIVVYHTEGKKFAICVMDYLCNKYGFDSIFSDYSSNISADSKNKKNNAHYLLGGIKAIYVDLNPGILCEKIVNIINKKPDSDEYVLEYNVTHSDVKKNEMLFSYVSSKTREQEYEDRIEAEKIESEIQEMNIEGKEKEAIIKIRVNQGKFRKRLIEKYGCCCICGVTNEHLLIASHIKPWSLCEDKEDRLDPDNGFLLCPNHDKLFDQGYISFNDDGSIIISSLLSEKDLRCFSINNNTRIFQGKKELSKKNKYFLEYHRNKRFNINL